MEEKHADVIPEGVESIGDHAFKGYTFSKITLPSSLKHLGEHAFSSVNLEEIMVAEGNPTLYLEDGVLFQRTEDGITLYAYPTAKQRKTYTVPEGVTAIDAGVFQETLLEEIILPGSLKTIGNSAFQYSALKQITLPQGLLRIEEAAFSDTDLQQIYIPGSVEFIGRGALSNTGITLRVHTGHTRKSWHQLLQKTKRVSIGYSGLTLIVGEPFWFIWEPLPWCLLLLGIIILLVADKIYGRRKKRREVES